MPLMSSTGGRKSGPNPVAEDFKAAGKGNEAQAEQEKAHPVEGAARSREIRHDVVGVEDADEPDGDVNQEIQCHVAYVTSQPPSRGPTTGPTRPGMLMKLSTATSSVRG